MRKIYFWLILLLPLPLQAEWITSAYLGKAYTHSADIQVVHDPVTDVSFNNVEFDDRSFDGPLYYGVRAGYMFRPAIGAEGEFIHLKAYARVNDPVIASGVLQGVGRITTPLPPSVVLAQYNVSHGLNLLIGNFVLRPALADRLDLTFRAGLGVSIPHPEIRAFDATLDEYQWHGTAVQLGSGLEFELTPRLFWLGEYKFTSTSPRFEVGGGTVQSSFTTHHFVTGVGLRF